MAALETVAGTQWVAHLPHPTRPRWNKIACALLIQILALLAKAPRWAEILGRLVATQCPFSWILDKLLLLNTQVNFRVLIGDFPVGVDPSKSEICSGTPLHPS